jgi:hypothetical protein
MTTLIGLMIPITSIAFLLWQGRPFGPDKGTPPEPRVARRSGSNQRGFAAHRRSPAHGPAPRGAHPRP